MFSRSVNTSKSFTQQPSGSVTEFFDCIINQKEDEIRNYFRDTSNQVWNLKEENGYTCLHRAVFMNSEKIVTIIIEELKKRLGIESKQELPKFVNEVTSEGITALHYAAYKGNIRIAKFLIDNGASVDVVTNRGKNVMHMSAEGNQPSIMIYFMNYHAQDIFSIDEYGSTPLHWACYSGAEEAVLFLFSLGAQIDAKDKEGLTPLHLAVLSKKERIVLRLLQKGADKNIENSKNEKPISIAQKKKYFNIVSLLEDEDYNPLCTLETPKMYIKPNDIYKKVIFLFLVIPEIIILLFILPFIEGYIETIINLSFFLVGFLSYLLLLMKEPGEKKNEELAVQANGENPLKWLVDNEIEVKDYCPVCYVKRDPKIRHCFICNKCIEGFEHHCFWLNRCIGKGNLVVYIIFLLCNILNSLDVIFVCVLGFLSNIYEPEDKFKFWRLISIGKGTKTFRIIASSGVFIFAVLVFVPLFFLVMLQFLKMCKMFNVKNKENKKSAKKKEEKIPDNALEISLVEKSVDDINNTQDRLAAINENDNTIERISKAITSSPKRIIENFDENLESGDAYKAPNEINQVNNQNVQERIEEKEEEHQPQEEQEEQQPQKEQEEQHPQEEEQNPQQEEQQPQEEVQQEEKEEQQPQEEVKPQEEVQQQQEEQQPQEEQEEQQQPPQEEEQQPQEEEQHPQEEEQQPQEEEQHPQEEEQQPQEEEQHPQEEEQQPQEDNAGEENVNENPPEENQEES